MAEDNRISRGRFLGGVAGAGAVGLGVGGVAGAFIGNKIGSDNSASAQTAAGEPAGARLRPFLIGSPYPLTGPSAGDGEQMKNGSALAIQEINDAGGIQGRTIDQIVIDADVYSPEGITTAFTKLVGEEVDAIAVGYLISDPTPSFDIVAPYGAPYLHAITLQLAIDYVKENPDKSWMLFQVDPPEVFYGRNFIPFIDGLEASGKWKPSSHTIHIIEGDSPYSQSISASLQQAAKESGKWEIVGVDPIVSPVNDWGPVLNNCRRTNPGVIMDTHFIPPELAALAKQFAANPTDSLFYLQYGPSVPEFLELAGDAANGFVWSTVTGVYNDEIGKAFQERYRAAFNSTAGFSNSGTGYDEVYMLARAWAMVGDPRDFKAVSNALRTMIHRGVNGGYYLDNEGQTGLTYPTQTKDPSLGQAHLYFQIQNGEHKIVSPEPFTDGVYTPAPWQSA